MNMDEETANKCKIWIGYWLAFFLFELVLTPFISIGSGICYFLVIVIFATYTLFSNKINETYKTMIYFFPILTIFAFIPMSLFTLMIYYIFGIYNV